MCGNGARCFARFIQKVVGATDTVSFETGAGIIKATFHGERVTVNLTKPQTIAVAGVGVLFVAALGLGGLLLFRRK